jgi:hypothetical protein
MVVPQPRGALEAYAPSVRPVTDDPAMNAGYRHGQTAARSTTQV